MHIGTRARILGTLLFATVISTALEAHGTVVFPASRVYRVYQANPSNPNFALASQAVQVDGELSYYTWNELSRNIPEALSAGLPPGFDYSPWVPDGQLASGGRVDPSSPLYPRTYAGLDQVSADWPKTTLVGGSTITVDFLATAAHNPSVWDVWMTTPGWDPATPLTWDQMEFIGRPAVTLSGVNYTFDLDVPTNRSGHHVLWVAWHRDDPVGEVFFSTSDIEITNTFSLSMSTAGTGDLTVELDGIPSGSVQGYTLFSFATAGPVGQGSFFGITPDAVTSISLNSPALQGGLFHFASPFAPETYPASAFSLPPGALLAVAGLSMDGVAGVLDSSFNVAVTNVERVTL